jgi:fucose permease
MPSPMPGSAQAAVRRAYRDLAVVAYLLYGVGAISPFLRDALHLSDAQTGLHSTVLAIGFLTAGLLADRLDRRAGPSTTHGVAALLAAAACVLLAWAPALAVTLAAGCLIGLAVGTMIGHVNGQLGRGGGPEAQLRLVRANAFSMVAALSVPVVIALALALGLAWQIVFVPSLLLLAVSFRDARRFGIPAAPTGGTGGRLPAAYWLAWLLLVTVVSVEFATVFWGATLVERRTGATLGTAALAGAAFFAGMLAGRIGLSVRTLGGAPPRLLIRIGLIIALAGAALVWVSTDVLLSTAGLFLTGLGVAGQYPLVVAVTLAAGSRSPAAAAARITLASGIAILASPLILGAAADAAGVERAWALVPAACVVALLLSVPVSRQGTRAGTGASGVA